MARQTGKTMGQATDFNRLRTKRKRGLFLRRLIILALIAGLIFAARSMGTMLVEHQLPTLAQNFFGRLGGPGFPVRMPAGNLEQVRALGSDIAVINGANLHLYGRNGRELLSAQRVGQGAVLLTAGNRMLTYTVGGQAFTIHFQNRQILEGEHDSPIRAAALGRTGNYAIVSSTMQFRSQLIVFNEQFGERFRRNTSELVAMVALCPSGNEVAAGSFATQGGELYSTVTAFVFDREEPLVRMEFHGEFILGLEYLNYGRIAVITDHGLRVIDTGAGRIVGSHDIVGGAVASSRVGDGQILLLGENPENRVQTAILFGESGQELGRATPQQAVRDMQVGSIGVFILTTGGITVYDHAMNEQGKHEQVGIQRILLAGGTLYYFVYGEIRVLGPIEIDVTEAAVYETVEGD
ncbi:MAG: DUF5711 family protein [Oscillospiraceae bacterium]|nr:DUF5711 family protein [Oscillospiraceae bacterium]